MGVDIDYEQALKWLRLSASKKDPTALCNLGHMYYKGWGVEPDDREALRLFLESANLGLDQAQFNLGVFYRDGHGTEPDPVASYVWFSLAARQEVKEAQARANTMRHYLTAAQLAEAERRLAEWKALTP
jgi:TPR repeat protein